MGNKTSYHASRSSDRKPPKLIFKKNYAEYKKREKEWKLTDQDRDDRIELFSDIINFVRAENIKERKAKGVEEKDIPIGSMTFKNPGITFRKKTS